MPVTVSLHDAFFGGSDFTEFKARVENEFGALVPEGYSVKVSHSYRTLHIAVTRGGGTLIDYVVGVESYPRYRYNCHRWDYHYGTTTHTDQFRIDWRSVETVKEAMDSAVEFFKNTFFKPESRGNIKTFLSKDKIDWSWKRPSNPDIVQENGDYFFAPLSPNHIQVFGDEGVFTWMRHEDTGDTINYGGVLWLKSALVPVYKNAIPFTQIQRHVPKSKIHMYEFIMVDGERRYIDIRRASSKLIDVAIHGYTTRIESLVPADKLFLKGTSDLYEKRSVEETPFLGWELEACTENREAAARAFKEHLPNMVMCKNDSSISPAGFETVSIPATLDFWKEAGLEAALNSMRVAPYNMRSFNHDSCGFHCHVSRSALSVLDLQKMERFVHNPANRDFMVKIAGRGSNTYQNYYDKLFNSRGEQTNTSENNGMFEEGGLKFFCDSPEEALSNAGYMISYPDPERKVAEYISSYIRYESCDTIIHGNFTSLGIILGDNGSYLIRNRCMSSYLYRAVTGDDSYITYITDGCGLSTLNEKKEFCRKLHRTFCALLSRHSNVFAGVLQRLGASDWEGVAQYVPPSTVRVKDKNAPIPEWKKQVVRKSSLKASRRDNYNVCLGISGPVGKATTGRYDVLNTRNTNTVEFRLFKGTMNPTSIMRYLEFVDALVRFVPTTSATDEGVNYERFVAWLINDGFNISRYEHLVSFIKANKLVNEKLIRRRTLPVVEFEDNKVAGIVAVKPKGFDADQSTAPVGTFSLSSVMPQMVEPAYDPDDEDYEVSEDDDTCIECGCYYEDCEC